MYRLLAALLAFSLLFPGVCAFAELLDEEDGEPGSEGEIIFLDNTDAVPREDHPLRGEPSAPVVLDKHIIGSDSRITVSNPRAYPFSAIALIEITFPCSCRKIVGTGFMIGRDELLTAAHCLICQEHNVWAKYLKLYFGYQKGKGSLCTYNGKWQAYCATSFPNGYTDVNDWAYIKLEKNVGDRTGWFGYWPKGDTQLESGYYYLAGYRDNILRYDSGTLEVIDSDRMWVNMDALPGNSGSPIFDYDNYVVGIWTSYWDSGRNSGIRMTNTIVNYFLSH